MPPPYCYEYPRPAVTVDLAVFALEGDELRVLLVRRGRDPFAGSRAFPGGFLDIDEPIEAGARRELREETGLEPTGPVEFLGVFGDPGRDPRGRTISLLHGSAVRGPLPAVSGGDDAAEAAWLPALGPGPLAFDHDAMLARALDWLAGGVRSGPLALALLPDEFGEGDVTALLRAVLETDEGSRAWLDRVGRDGQVREIPGRPGRYRRRGP